VKEFLIKVGTFFEKDTYLKKITEKMIQLFEYCVVSEYIHKQLKKLDRKIINLIWLLSTFAKVKNFEDKS